MNRRPLAIAIALLGFASTARPVEADLLIANVGTNSILRYNEANNTLSTFSTGDNGALQVPHGMAYGPDGNLYVTSLGTGSILEYNGKSGAFLGTFVPHTVGSTTLQYPNAIAFDPNNSRYLYVSDFFDNRIDRYDMRTSALSVYATLPTTAASANHLQGPTGLVFGFDGNLYVNNSSQLNGSQIRQYNVQAGDTVGRSIVSGFSDSITHLNSPSQLAFGPTTAFNPPLLLDTGFFQNSVNSYQLSFQRGEIDGKWSHQIAGVSPGGLNEPGGVAYDPNNGRVIISNYLGNTLVSASLNGTSDVTTLHPTSIGGAVLDNPTYLLMMPINTTIDPVNANGLGNGGPATLAPEPASLTLFSIGVLACLAAHLRRRWAA